MHAQLLKENPGISYKQLRKLEKLDIQKAREAAALKIAEQAVIAGGQALKGAAIGLGHIGEGYLSGDAIAFAAKSVAGLVFYKWFVTAYPHLAKQLHLNTLDWPGSPPPPAPTIPPTARGGVDPFGNPTNHPPDTVHRYGVTFRYFNPFDNAWDLTGQEWFPSTAERDAWIQENTSGSVRIQVTGYLTGVNQ